MPTSEENWSNKLRKIGEVEQPDHTYLSKDDECWYFGEYTPKGNSDAPAWSLSKTNGIISNLKKSPLLRETNQWPHKLRAIRETGALIRANILVEALSSITFIPAPPSKPVGHHEYDPRMSEVAAAVGDPTRVAPILRCIEARDPAHQSDRSRSPDAIYENIEIYDAEIESEDHFRQVIILDDVITTGATFVACKRRVLQRFPAASVLGLFVARRVPDNSFPEINWDDFIA